MRVDQPQVTQFPATASAARRASATDKSLFGAALTQASAATTSPNTAASGTAGQNSAAETVARPKAKGRAEAQHAPALTPAEERIRAKAIRVPRGESYADVAGRRFDEITDGPRNGMFINRSGNKRDGMAFVLVERNGREFHVYGSGKDRLIVEVKHRPKPETRTSEAKAPEAPATHRPAATPTRPAAPTPAAPAVAH